MQFRNTEESFGAVHQLLHWVIGLSMIAMVALGFYMEDLEPNPGKYELYGIHKALGITILILVALRLFWRFTNKIPPMPADMNPLQIFAAKGTHFMLYVLMLGMPIGGWLMSSAGGHPVSLWGLPLPSLTGGEKIPELGKLANSLHEIGGWALVVFISLHFAGAMYHQFVRKDGLLWRMLPCSCSGKAEASE